MISKRKIERQSQNGHTEFENEDNEFNIGAIVNLNYILYFIQIIGT